GGSACAGIKITDVNIGITGGKICAGSLTQPDVVVPSGVTQESLKTMGRVLVPRRVVGQRHVTRSRIVVAARVTKEGIQTIGRVQTARGIAIKGLRPEGGVIEAGRVAQECLKTFGRVVVAG